MSWPELHRTLAELVAGAEVPPGSGLRIDRVELDFPLETATARRDHALVLLARAPHSRWTAGFLPAVHRGRLVLEADVTEGGGDER